MDESVIEVFLIYLQLKNRTYWCNTSIIIADIHFS